MFSITGISEITQERRFDTFMDTKIRLLQLGMKQVDLIALLAEHGINAVPCEISLAINGKGTQEKHKKILEVIDEILTEKEKSCDMGK